MLQFLSRFFVAPARQSHSAPGASPALEPLESREVLDAGIPLGPSWGTLVPVPTARVADLRGLSNPNERTLAEVAPFAAAGPAIGVALPSAAPATRGPMRPFQISAPSPAPMAAPPALATPAIAKRAAPYSPM